MVRYTHKPSHRSCDDYVDDSGNDQPRLHVEVLSNNYDQQPDVELTSTRGRFRESSTALGFVALILTEGPSGFYTSTIFATLTAMPPAMLRPDCASDS